jgi:dihydrodipicolinate synthase/N-acetylneuraminate lyase
MADPAVLGLIGTLSGTAIGFAGSLVTQLLLEGRRQAADRKKRKAEKFEELVSAVFEHNNWIFTMHHIELHGSDERLPPHSPY